jgi:hypothetical protein
MVLPAEKPTASVTNCAILNCPVREIQVEFRHSKSEVSRAVGSRILRTMQIVSVISGAWESSQVAVLPMPPRKMSLLSDGNRIGLKIHALKRNAMS